MSSGRDLPRVLVLSRDWRLVESLRQEGRVRVVAHVEDPELAASVLGAAEVDIALVDEAWGEDFPAVMARAATGRPGGRMPQVFLLRPDPPASGPGPGLSPVLSPSRAGAPDAWSGGRADGGMTLRDWWKRGPADDAAGEPEPVRAAGPEVLMRQVITVISPKGGVGKTFISVNLGAALARHTGFRVLLVDLDLRSGDAAVHLDLVGRPTLAELLPYAGELSEEHLDRAVVTHDLSGLEVLLAPVRPEAADMLTREHLEALIRVTRQRYDFVIIDTPPDPSDAAVVECLRETTAVLLVSSLDAAALRQCRLLLDSSALGGRDLSRRLFIILNQAHGRAPLPASRAAAFLKADAGAGRVFEIPEDRPCVERAVFEGRPVVLTSPEHPVARGIYELAHTFCPVFTGLLGAGSRRPAGLRSLIEAIRRW
ncbi:MAG TPA: hypothetical protein DHW14_09675 [Clostridiales bacterium]|nr:hypothetical protein [Clostridiales bacterium]